MNTAIKFNIFLDLILLAIFGLAYWGSKTDSIRDEFGGGLLDLLVVFTASMLVLAVIMGTHELLKCGEYRSLAKAKRYLKKHEL